jgi:hypothetical protein
MEGVKRGWSCKAGVEIGSTLLLQQRQQQQQQQQYFQMNVMIHALIVAFLFLMFIEFV